jgi:hypothetical protein
MAVVVFIAAGMVSGVFLGYLGARLITRALGGQRANYQLINWFAIGGAIAIVPVAAVLAFLGGGNIGGGIGAYISESMGAGSIGALFGIAIGIAAVLAVGLAIGAFVGGGIGYLVTLAVGRRSAG